MYYAQAFDGYDRNATTLRTIPLPPTADNATVPAMAIRNSAIFLLYTDGTVAEIKLDPATGLPAAGAGATSPTPLFNLTNVLLSDSKTSILSGACRNRSGVIQCQSVGPQAGPLAVDANGTVYIAGHIMGAAQIVMVNSSKQYAGKIQMKTLPSPQCQPYNGHGSTCKPSSPKGSKISQTSPYYSASQY